MKLNLKLSVAALCASLSMSSQTLINGRGCATLPPPAEWDTWFNTKVEEHKQNLATGKTQDAVYTIPVVVHVIYDGTVPHAIGSYPNISQAQINSQINVLNADYSGTGYNVGNLAATAFSAVGAATCGISFCLAQLDPSGNTLAEPGIDRIDFHTIPGASDPSSFSSQSTFQNHIDGVIKPNTIWDPSSYFNIWITHVNSGVGLLGYATFPPGSGLTGLTSNVGTASTDGIWVYTRAFGNTGNVQAPYNKGRTASHETGHYLGLRHIGGDGNNNPTGDCSATDYCNDTPPQKGGFASGAYGQNFGAPTYPLYATGTNACPLAPNGNMFMNIMDYTDDASNYMFTPDQNTRFHAALVNSPYRNQLTASSEVQCAVSVVPVTGIAKTTLLTRNISLAPNPSSGQISIITSLPESQNLTVSIHNYLGQLVFTAKYTGVTSDTFNINLDNCSGGVYSVTVENGSEKTVKRLILSK